MNNPYLKKELKYYLHTFKRQPLMIAKSKGAEVWDEKGKRYFDFYSGLAVCGVGHNHPKVVKAIKAQADKVLHTSNFFYNQPNFDLAIALTSKYKNSKVFFSNSGAEANELAIKCARLWAQVNKKKGRDIITFENSFHGRTLATAAASSGGKQSQVPFGPLPTGFKSVPFNDILTLKKSINEKTIAIMMELVQGEGGIHIADLAFVAEIKKLSQNKNLILIIDEIQTGMGRTGSFFAFEQYGLKPDIVTLAKGLAGGLPLGATLTQPKISKLMEPGLHGSTFGGNPVSCAASLEVLKLLGPTALNSIRRSSARLRDKLSRFLQYRSVKSVRGLGLMLAIELNQPGAPYVDLARKKGLLINCTQGRILRFLPPYFLSEKDSEKCLSLLDSVFKIMN